MKTKVIKIRCNVCGSKEIIKLHNPETKVGGFTVYCPDCDKRLAEIGCDSYGVNYWHLYDSKYSESFGGIPVEVVEF